MMLKKVNEAAKTGVAAVGIALLVVALFCLVPFLAIWACNTLFELEIAHTPLNYFCVLLLVALLRGDRT